MISKTNMKSIEITCFHSLWKRASFVLFFINSKVYTQIFIQDSSRDQKAKAYVTTEVAIIDFSETKKCEIAYINGNDKKLKNHPFFGKTFQAVTKTNKALCLKRTSAQRFFAGQLSGLNIGILVNISKNKVGQLHNVLLDLLLLSKKIKILVGFSQKKITPHSEFFFTRPPPFFIV